MPRPFGFKLQRVLEYREQLEEQAKMAFALALRQRDEQAARMADLEHRLDRHLKSWFADKDMTTGDIWLWRNYKQRLEEDIARAKLSLDRLELELKSRRKELVDRSTERKLLERLKINQEMAFRSEENLREQRESDEMATLRFQHQNT